MENKQFKEMIRLIDALKLGINPNNGELLEDKSIVNEINISRALHYASDILKNNIKVTKEVKENFYITNEEYLNIVLDDKKRTISDIAAFITEKVIVHEADCRKNLNQKIIADWLVEPGFLEEIDESGKKAKRPTDAGQDMGISIEYRRGMYGAYKVNIYDKVAQSFIIDNIGCFINIK